MKLVFALLFLFSSTARSQGSYDREIRMARAGISTAQQHKANLEEIHVGANRIASASTASKWIGFGIPAYLAAAAATGFIGVLFGTMGALQYASMDKDQYAAVRKMMETDYFTPEQKILVDQYLHQMLKGKPNERIYADVQLLRLTLERTKQRVADELRKENYLLEGGSYLSRPQRVANYLSLQIAMADFEIGMQNQILRNLEFLETQR